MVNPRPTIDWLLSSDHPAVNYLTLLELLELPDDDPRVQAARLRIEEDACVLALLAGQQPDG